MAAAALSGPLPLCTLLAPSSLAVPSGTAFPAAACYCSVSKQIEPGDLWVLQVGTFVATGLRLQVG